MVQIEQAETGIISKGCKKHSAESSIEAGITELLYTNAKNSFVWVCTVSILVFQNQQFNFMDIRDTQKSVNWAIASIGGGGLIVSVALFDIVNMDSFRGQQAILTEGGISTQFGTAAAGPITYTTFKTSKPVSFDDFDGAGARFTTASLAVYSWGWLTIFEDAAYLSRVLAHVRMDGWSIAIPGGGVGHGVIKMIYGSGSPVNASALHRQLVLDLPFNDTPYPDHIIPKEDPIRGK